MAMFVSIVSNRPKHARYRATNAKPLFVPNAIGVMNIMPNMRFESVIDVTHFCVEIVMKWINVMIVETSFVPPVRRCSVVNSVGVDYVKNVLPLVHDVESYCAIETPNLLWGVNHVGFAIVWYVWHHRPRIHACGVHINHQNEWNNSFICASKRFTKPLRNPTPTIPTTTNHYLHLHHLSQ